MKQFLLAAASCAFLCQCSVFNAGRNDGIDENPFDALETQVSSWKDHSPRRVKVPILRSRTYDRQWGRPELLVGPKGSYALRYRNPANRAISMVIVGSPDKFEPAGITPPPYTDIGRDRKTGKLHPREVSQSWRTAEISGENVKFCISEEVDGAHPNHFVTETFRLKDKKGREGSYRVRVASGREKTRYEVTRMLKTVRF